MGEMLSIVLIFYSLLDSKNLLFPRFYQQLFGCFFLFAVSSFLVLFWVDIYPIPDSSPLQKVGWITVSRLVELFGCSFLALFIHNVLVSHSIKFNKIFLRTVDRLMFSFFIFFAFTYISCLIGFENNFVYANYRLRGGFAEGGLFGLFVAYYLILRIRLFGIEKMKCVLMILLIIASQSKSAILFIFLTFIFHVFLTRRIRLKNIFIGGIFCATLLFFANQHYRFFEKMMFYWQYHQSAEYIVEARSTDYNIVAGRIAESFIAPEMIRDNIMLGVGLGNYPLTRNNPKYLGFFPEIPIRDLGGWGGIVRILVELGVVGLFLFLHPFAVLFRCSKEKSVKWMVGLVILVQISGVYTHFQYIWFLVGLMTAIDSKPEVIHLEVRNKSFC
jgi:hypothetical protein